MKFSRLSLKTPSFLGSKRFHPDQNLKQQIWWVGMNYSNGKHEFWAPPISWPAFWGWGNPMREKNIWLGEVLFHLARSINFGCWMEKTWILCLFLDFFEREERWYAWIMQNLNRILSQKEPHNEFQNTKTQCWLCLKNTWCFFKGNFSQCFDLLKKFQTNPKHFSIWSNYSDLTRPHPKWWFSKGKSHYFRET